MVGRALGRNPSLAGIHLSPETEISDTRYKDVIKHLYKNIKNSYGDIKPSKQKHKTLVRGRETLAKDIRPRTDTIKRTCTCNAIMPPCDRTVHVLFIKRAQADMTRDNKQGHWYRRAPTVL